jgi:hypothetical protein
MARFVANLDEKEEIIFLGKGCGEKPVKDDRICQNIDKNNNFTTETQRAQRSTEENQWPGVSGQWSVINCFVFH